MFSMLLVAGMDQTLSPIDFDADSCDALIASLLIPESILGLLFYYW